MNFRTSARLWKSRPRQPEGYVEGFVFYGCSFCVSLKPFA